MMNATATMAIDIFMNADIEPGLSFEIIFVIRIGTLYNAKSIHM
jgi:hypothetical protein